LCRTHPVEDAYYPGTGALGTPKRQEFVSRSECRWARNQEMLNVM
jgi:hypothetical protein